MNNEEGGGDTNDRALWFFMLEFKEIYERTGNNGNNVTRSVYRSVFRVRSKFIG